MEAPWYMRSLAMATNTPLGSRTQTLRADGKDYPGTYQLDRKLEQSSQSEKNHHFVVDRTTKLPSGKQATVRSDWNVHSDTLTNETKVEVAGSSPLEIGRVFERTPKD
ncbi:MAG: hypothetical protein P8R42_02685 [Candidatus Binatia bacterium]|nr:hypothetical protein [Candidatus Binatia bacterium]